MRRPLHLSETLDNRAAFTGGDDERFFAIDAADARLIRLFLLRSNFQRSGLFAARAIAAVHERRVKVVAVHPSQEQARLIPQEGGDEAAHDRCLERRKPPLLGGAQSRVRGKRTTGRQGH